MINLNLDNRSKSSGNTLRQTKSDENKPAGNWGEGTIQGCYENKETTQSDICVSVAFKFYHMGIGDLNKHTTGLVAGFNGLVM
jgi:hypothetical protein